MVWVGKNNNNKKKKTGKQNSHLHSDDTLQGWSPARNLKYFQFPDHFKRLSLETPHRPDITELFNKCLKSHGYHSIC